MAKLSSFLFLALFLLSFHFSSISANGTGNNGSNNGGGNNGGNDGDGETSGGNEHTFDCLSNLDIQSTQIEEDTIEYVFANSSCQVSHFVIPIFDCIDPSTVIVESECAGSVSIKPLNGPCGFILYGNESMNQLKIDTRDSCYRDGSYTIRITVPDTRIGTGTIGVKGGQDCSEFEGVLVFLCPECEDLSNFEWQNTSLPLRANLDEWEETIPYGSGSFSTFITGEPEVQFTLGLLDYCAVRLQTWVSETQRYANPIPCGFMVKGNGATFRVRFTGNNILFENFVFVIGHLMSFGSLSSTASVKFLSNGVPVSNSLISVEHVNRIYSSSNPCCSADSIWDKENGLISAPISDGGRVEGDYLLLNVPQGSGVNEVIFEVDSISDDFVDFGVFVNLCPGIEFDCSKFYAVGGITGDQVPSSQVFSGVSSMQTFFNFWIQFFLFVGICGYYFF